MKREKLKTIGFWLAVGLIAAGIITVVVVTLCGREDRPEEPTRTITEEPIVRYITRTETKEVEKLIPVEVEKEITTDILEEGLRDMGMLITEEYLFKEVTSFSSTKTFAWIIKANSKLVMGYEGTITAGIDFSGIAVSKDDAQKKITVKLPESSIYNCALDYSSFEVYQEDVSRWNPISASDYNGSVEELEQRAQQRALERGILDKADRNAQLLIRNFIASLVDLSAYSLEFTH